jgi:cysteine-rich repeat protein
MKKYSPAACLLLAGCFSPGADIPSATTGTSSTSATSTGETSTSTLSATMTTSASEPATSSSTGAPSDTEGQQTTVDSTSADSSKCGDGMLDPEEECDDGATADEDGCSAVCTKELRRVFVTSAVFTGDLGGRAGADAKCQAAAESASAPGTFRAWLSTNNGSPADDFVKSAVPYVRLDDVQVAADWQDLGRWHPRSADHRVGARRPAGSEHARMHSTGRLGRMDEHGRGGPSVDEGHV